MKDQSGFGIFAILVIFMVALLALTTFYPPPVSAAPRTNVIQITPTPPIADPSEIGSTNGILIMGVAIVLIVILPLAFRKRINK